MWWNWKIKRLTCKLKFDWDSITWPRWQEITCPPMPHPLLVMSSFGCKQLLLSYFLTHPHALNNESRLRCAISCDLLPPWSCDRISIKLQLTGKSRLIFQLYKWSSVSKSLDDSDKRGDIATSCRKCSKLMAFNFRPQVRFLSQLGLTKRRLAQTV